ncbi:MAG: type III secretion system protein [Plesiomonas sp.]
MNLVMERNLQHFVHLVGLAEEPISSEMQWKQKTYLLHLAVKCERLTLTTGRYDIANMNNLMILQGRWRLENFQGIPQRVFMLSHPFGVVSTSTTTPKREYLMISCTAPYNSSAECWYQLYMQQRLLLRNIGSSEV